MSSQSEGEQSRPRSLEGRRIIVTGAAGGIGGAAVRGFAARGARVAGVYNRSPPGDDLEPLATWYRADLSRRQDLDRAFDEAVAGLGGLDALVHTAGVWRGGSPEEADEDQFDFLFATNVKSTMFANQAAFRHLRGQGGRIVNVGSPEGVTGSAVSPVYAATRGAVQTWTRSAALAWGRHRINVNAIAPILKTPLSERVMAGMSAKHRAAARAGMAAAIPIGGDAGDPLRDGEPLLAFLVGEESRFITGQLIAVDGGFRMLGA